MLRVRFAPSPTGYLHIGGARTFIFNWLFARRFGGTMILRIDDTDVERNTQVSLDSIFDGLRWLDLGWDEEYRQSDRVELHRRMAGEILAKGLAYRDFTPALKPSSEDEAATRTKAIGCLTPGCASSRKRKATGAPLRVSHSCCAIASRATLSPKSSSRIWSIGRVSKSTADIEDFALLRSTGVPTYHMACCADDADLGITHILRGQEHLANTFKHILIFDALGRPLPQFAHLPLLIAPDGSKLSKRKHGPVVSVTTYRDAGFLPHGFINFVCLRGWSPKDDREVMSRQELIDVFSLEGIHHSNAMVNFTEDDPFDPKAVWLNAEHLKQLPLDELASRLLPFVPAADLCKMRRVAPLIRERIKLLREVAQAADFFFLDDLPPYDPAGLIPQKGDAAMARAALDRGRRDPLRGRIHPRRTRLRSARGSRGIENQSGTNVPAHSRGRVRAQGSAAAV